MQLPNMRDFTRISVTAIALLAAIPVVVFTYNSQPPTARTGGFGERDCTSCHGGTVNSSTGKVIIGAPAFYTPGATVPITVNIQDTAAGRQRWGFELSARFKDGRQAGSFAAAPPVGVQTAGNVQYAGNAPGPTAPGSSYTFTMNWTAPADTSGGDVVFNAAGMAANGDSSTGGDHTFTASATATVPSGAVVSSGGVVNAASFSPAPNNSVAPGALVSIFGTNLAPTTTGAGSLPLPTVLAGTQVTINGVAAPLIFVSQSQINAQVPFESSPGSTLNLVVKIAGLPDSKPEPVRVEAVSPAIFTLTQNGAGAAAVLHADFALVSTSAPAKPGETVLIYCTGLGATQPLLKSGAAGNGELTVQIPTITIGGQNARVDFSGAAPGFAGLYQVNAVVPMFTTGGIYEVIISSAGILSRSGVTISVQP